MIKRIYNSEFFIHLLFIIYISILLSNVLYDPTHIFIGMPGDAQWTMWSFGAAFHRLIEFKNPFVSYEQNFPYGINLITNAGMVLIGISLGWLKYVGTTVLIYNIIFFANNYIIILFIYLLLKKLNVQKPLAVVGALLSIIIPYLTAQELGHPNLFVISPVIAIIYLFALWWKGEINKKQIYAIGILFAAEFYLGLEIFASFTLILLITAVVMYFIYKNQFILKIIKNKFEILKAVIITTIIVIPGLLMYFYGDSHVLGTPQGSSGSNIYVSDLLSFIIPSQNYLLHSNTTLMITNQFTGNPSENDAYLGIPILFIIFWSFHILWRKKWIKVLALVSLITTYFSMGYSIHILGVATKVPGLWRITEYLPVIKGILPGRLMFYSDVIFLIVIITAVNEVMLLTKRVWIKLSSLFVLVLLFIFWLPNYHYTKVNSIDYALKNKKISELLIGSPVYVISQNLNEVLLSVSLAYNKIKIANFYGRIPTSDIYNNALYNSLLNLPNGISPKMEYEYYRSSLEYYLPKERKNGIDHLMYFPSLNTYIPMEMKRAIISLLNHPVYNHRGIMIWSIPRNISNHKSKIQQFNQLFGAAMRFLLSSKNNTISDLYPLNLENANYLPKYLGGSSTNNPAYNWTNFGGWLGAWGTNFGVGIVGDESTAKEIYNIYKEKDIIQIYYPYPNVITNRGIMSGKSNNTQGQLLVIFKNPINYSK